MLMKFKTSVYPPSLTIHESCLFDYQVSFSHNTGNLQILKTYIAEGYLTTGDIVSYMWHGRT